MTVDTTDTDALTTSTLDSSVELLTEELARVRRRSNVILAVLIFFLLATLSLFGVYSFQTDNAIGDLNNKIADLSKSEQDAALINRKFEFLLAQCAKAQDTPKGMEACVEQHFKPAYKCDEDANKGVTVCSFFGSPKDLPSWPPAIMGGVRPPAGR